MQITQRQSVIGVLSLLATGDLLVLILQLVQGAMLIDIFASVVGLLVILGLLVAYWRGWEYARHAAVALMTLLVVVALPEIYVSQQLSLAIVIPPLIALVFTSSAWIAGSAATVLLGLIIRAGGRGVYAEPIVILLYSLLTSGMVIARLVLATTRQTAEQAREQAEQAAAALTQANAGLEAQVAARTAELQAQADEQARLLADQTTLLVEVEQQRTTIRELSVPVIPISATTLIMPLVGALDTERLHHLQAQALHALERSAAQRIILDITGVAVVDSQVAQGLMVVMQAARLLGAKVLLVGIRPEVAQAIVGLGLDLRGLQTFSDLQSALGALGDHHQVME